MNCKESALSLAQLVLSQDAESSLRQMSSELTCTRADSILMTIVLFFFFSLGLALCDYRTPKVRKGTLVSVFSAI
jgi:hypothetical protein